MLEFRKGLINPLQHKDYALESIMDLYLAQTEGIDGIDCAINRYQLEEIMFPAHNRADICAKAGYPSIAIPAGYGTNGRPFGVTFAGKAFTEPSLIRIAYSFEQKTKLRKKTIFN